MLKFSLLYAISRLLTVDQGSSTMGAQFRAHFALVVHLIGARPHCAGFSNTVESVGTRGKWPAASSSGGLVSPLDAVDAAESSRSNLFKSVEAARNALKAEARPPAELSATSSSIRDILNVGTLVGNGAPMVGERAGPDQVAAIYASNLNGAR